MGRYATNFCTTYYWSANRLKETWLSAKKEVQQQGVTRPRLYGAYRSKKDGNRSKGPVATTQALAATTGNGGGDDDDGDGDGGDDDGDGDDGDDGGDDEEDGKYDVAADEEEDGNADAADDGEMAPPGETLWGDNGVDDALLHEVVAEVMSYDVATLRCQLAAMKVHHRKAAYASMSCKDFW